jgi:hypothetical protein
MPTNSPDTSRSTPRSLGASLAVAVLLAAGAPCADATLLVYEGFDYGVGDQIADQNGGTGFNGTWFNHIGAANGSVGSGSLTFGGHPTSGNSGIFDVTLIRRSFEAIPGTPGTQTWASFLFSTSVSTVDISNDYAAMIGLAAFEDIQGGFTVGAFADEAGDLFFGFGYDYNLPAQLSSIAVQSNQTYLLTVSIDWNPGLQEETIRLYLNPPGGAAPVPGDAIATLTRNVASPPWNEGDSNPNVISYLYAGGLVPGGAVTFDEIRIGTTFADVVPVPEPSTAGLVAIALGVFARFRVRRA